MLELILKKSESYFDHTIHSSFQNIFQMSRTVNSDHLIEEDNLEAVQKRI